MSGCTPYAEGWRALKRGHWQDVLDATPADTPQAFKLRARAWLGLGDLIQADAELRMGLVLDPSDTGLHLLAAEVARKRHLEGDEFRQLQQIDAADLPAQAEARWRFLRAKRKLLRRGRMRGTPACPGFPPKFDDTRPLPRKRSTKHCMTIGANQRVDYIPRRTLHDACLVPQVALDLERQGCLADARRAWELLEKADPKDTVGRFQRARIEIILNKMPRAKQLLIDYRYFSADRFAATIKVARLMAVANNKTLASYYAVKALALAKNDAQRDTARTFLNANVIGSP